MWIFIRSAVALLMSTHNIMFLWRNKKNIVWLPCSLLDIYAVFTPNTGAPYLQTNLVLKVLKKKKSISLPTDVSKNCWMSGSIDPDQIMVHAVC